MKKTISKILVAASLALLTVSCVDKNKGPEICPSSTFKFTASDLKVTGLNASSEVDLSAGGLNIKADFTEKVKWELKIVAVDGSAISTHKGESKGLDILWYGNSDKLPFFGKGSCKIELEIACLDKVTKDFSVTANPTFASFMNPNFGFLVRDFDKNGTQAVSGPDFVQNVDGFLWADLQYQFEVKYLDDKPSPAGGKYMKLWSKRDKPTWYYFVTGINNVTSDFTKLPTMNADSLYYNAFVRGKAGLKNTAFEPSIMLGVTQYTRSMNVSGEEWTYVSFPFSEFKTLQGEYVKDISNITTIIWGLGSNPEMDVEAEYGVDFTMITVGAPLLPKEGK